MTTYQHSAKGAANLRRPESWIHLVYLATPLFQPVFSGATRDWVLAIVTIGGFLPMWALSALYPARTRWLCAIPATVLGTLLTPFLAGASILFVYVAAAVGLAESRRTALRCFAGLTLLVVLLTPVTQTPMPWRLWALAPTVLFIWIIGVVQIGEACRRRESADLRLRHARAERLATLAERERIARDLHDLLGHTLTAVVIKAQLVRELVELDPARARTEADGIESTAREALSEVRAAITGWRQSSLDTELETASGTLSSMGVTLTVQREGDLTLMGPAEHELALALREVLTNVARHSGARTCHVAIGADSGELRLVVADDGRGGDVVEGNGLTGVRERITALGGQIRRSGTVGTSGTTVTIGVPLEVAT
ncbi:sensor histidine kinase [Amycolatopsis nigrescens]|uniref:sensor histidine kinase n=1 Tax=Amycolatopsis nigrescens TaxID=381445 RepID=UPI00036733EE|nr:sensor histidine kinase [Amycolatopsis nigrescens]